MWRRHELRLHLTERRKSVSGMTALHKTLAEINSIRGHMARGMEFRGYGSPKLATTGFLALIAAAVRAHWLKNPKHDILVYLALWVARSAGCSYCALIATQRRARVCAAQVEELKCRPDRYGL
jgi:hypothetical protein